MRLILYEYKVCMRLILYKYKVMINNHHVKNIRRKPPQDNQDNHFYGYFFSIISQLSFQKDFYSITYLRGIFHIPLSRNQQSDELQQYQH